MDRTPYPEPTTPRSSRDYYLAALDYSRDAVIAKVAALPASSRVSTLPSGWTPLALLKHLTYVEMRWLEWGFEGADTDAPFADRVDGVFAAKDEETVDVLMGELVARGATSRAIIGSHDLDEVGQPSERWDGDPPPTLEQILRHLTYEYARHLGHLDIVLELATGQVGE